MWRERVGRRRGARALCCAVLLAAASVAGGEERLPGWQGETCAASRASPPAGRSADAQPSRPRHSSSSTQLLRGQATGGEAAPEPWIEQLSWHPRAWLYHNFMSKEECEYLIQQARCSSPPHVCSVLTPATRARPGGAGDGEVGRGGQRVRAEPRQRVRALRSVPRPCATRCVLSRGIAQHPHQLGHVSAERAGRHHPPHRGAHRSVFDGALRYRYWRGDSPLARARLTRRARCVAPDHGEGIQVLHYEEGQKYEVRRRSCCNASARHATQR
jgi:hypothetical protein